MFRFSLTLILVVFWVASLLAQETSQADLSEYKPFKHQAVSARFITWTELADLDNGLITEPAYANFIGFALGHSWKRFRSPLWGSISEVNFLYGQANLGGTSTLVRYQTSHRSFYGLSASYHWAYRHSPSIIASIGPTALHRQIEWPPEGTTVDVRSGALLNLGLTAELKYRTGNRWELRQSFGTLFFKAATIWSFGMSYLY